MSLPGVPEGPEVGPHIDDIAAGPPAVARPSSFGRRLRHPIEGLAVGFFIKLFGALPLDAASALGALIGGTVGAALPINRTARMNLKRAFPDMSDAELRRTLRAMWRHLGRVAAEYPHLGKLAEERIEFVGTENLEEAKRHGGPGIYFSGHIGNWEICPIGPIRGGIPLAAIYRAPNNPIVDRIMWRTRHAVLPHQVPKGPAGARQIIDIMRKRGSLAFAADQRMNNGIAVPFFGRDAMTAPALAELAIKYDCPIYPIRVERLKGAHFRLTIGPPLAKPQDGTRQQKVYAIMLSVNEMMERWIRERREQWVWSHHRWQD